MIRQGTVISAAEWVAGPWLRTAESQACRSCAMFTMLGDGLAND